MAKWCANVMLVLAVAAAHTSARNTPSDHDDQVVHNTAKSAPTDAGLDDQKNFLTYGGVGGFSGIGSNGLPFGGVGGLGGITGLGGAGGLGGIGGVGGLGGSSGLGGVGGVGGGVGGGAGGGVGGGSAGGFGTGTGVLPFPWNSWSLRRH